MVSTHVLAAALGGRADHEVGHGAHADLAAEREGVLDLSGGHVLLEPQQPLFSALLDAELDAVAARGLHLLQERAIHPLHPEPHRPGELEAPAQDLVTQLMHPLVRDVEGVIDEVDLFDPLRQEALDLVADPARRGHAVAVARRVAEGAAVGAAAGGHHRGEDAAFAHDVVVAVVLDEVQVERRVVVEVVREVDVLGGHRIVGVGDDAGDARAA
jgi:hypothetical protein